MKRIQIITTKPYGHPFPVISWLIRLCQWSKESHVVIYFPEEQIVRHAHFNNIKEENIDDFISKNRIVNLVSISLTEEDYLKIYNFSKNLVGKQKGYWSTLLGSLVPQICRRLFDTRLKNPFYKGITCSEFVRLSFKQINEVLVSVLTNSIPEGTFTTSDAMELSSKVKAAHITYN